MKVLVTGGAGYIGSHTILEILENTNWEVVSVDNFDNSSEETYERIKQITGKQVSYYVADLKNLEDTRAIFKDHKDIKGVIHFAAHKAVGESVEQPLKYYDNNINSLRNILVCLEEFNVPYLIFSSSCAVYGNIKDLPVTEKSEVNVVESPYAHTKIIGERMIEDFLKQKEKMKALSLRYFNPVGAHESGLNGELSSLNFNNLMPYITQFAIGNREELIVFGDDYETRDGTCVRDYIHVCDIANAHILALKYLSESKFEETLAHDVINLGTGVGSSVLEMIDSFERVNNLKLDYKIGEKRDGDIGAIYANNEKAKQVLGWEPKRDLDEMMRSTWKWEQHYNNTIKN